MRNIILIIGLTVLIISTPSWGMDCYRFNFKGVVRATPNSVHIVVNEGTMSEYRLSIGVLEAHKALSFKNTTVEGSCLFKNKPNYHEHIYSILKITRGTPNPLHPIENSYLTANGKMKCQ